MKRMTTSRREDPESEPEKSPNKGLECNCHPRHGSCVRTSRATGASPLSPDVRHSQMFQLRSRLMTFDWTRRGVSVSANRNGSSINILARPTIRRQMNAANT
jgi:hypothetical protein